MRVPAGPTPLIPLPPSVTALNAAAAPAGSAARTDFSGSEVLRQALANAPAPTPTPKPAALPPSSPTLTPAATMPVPAGLTSALPVQAVPVALQAALLAYADRTPVETMPGTPSSVPLPTPPTAPVPGANAAAAAAATVPQLPLAATPPSLSPATSATTPQDTVLQTVVRAPTEASGPAVLRQSAVIGLLRALVGNHGALPEAGLATRPGAMPMPAPDTLPDVPGPPGASPLPTASPAPRGVNSPAVMLLASGDLLLRFELPAQAAGGARVPMQAELLLHPTLVRYAPQLAAALAASEWKPGSELPTLNLPLGTLPQGALPPSLGFQLMASPAALWPLMVCIASGQLRVAGADADRIQAIAQHDADEEEAGNEDTPEEPAEERADNDSADHEAAESSAEDECAPVDELDGEAPLTLGTRVAYWIAAQRLRQAIG